MEAKIVSKYTKQSHVYVYKQMLIHTNTKPYAHTRTHNRIDMTQNHIHKHTYEQNCTSSLILYAYQVNCVQKTKKNL